MKNKVSIITLGPSIAEKGGMGSVAKLLIASNTKEFSFTHLTTWDSDLSKVSLLVCFFKSCVMFLAFLLKNRVDVAHLHVSEGGSLVRTFILSTMAWAFRKPVVLHAHGCEFHTFYEQLPTLGKHFINFYFRHCKILIVLSESWKQFYINACKVSPKNIIVLKNPVAIPNDVPQRTEDEQITFLFMGKINKRKGIYDLVEALSHLEPEIRSQMILILAGSGEIQQVQQLAESLKVIDCLRFPGWVDADERDQLLSIADVFVLPSYNEGLPMALLEAMAWALPSITTPVGGIPEVIDSGVNGLLVQPGDIVALASAISDLITHNDLRHRLGIQARENVAELDISCYREKILELYDNVLAQDKRYKSELRLEKL